MGTVMADRLDNKALNRSVHCVRVWPVVGWSRAPIVSDSNFHNFNTFRRLG
ncbi:hypothetical protein MFFC18_21420 [Mariniblastus fucicola]|uniref:Uncharacterized protein n=1 Tax=Mariniblastus fucicola TaxID=980251 RepID=A0A5B9PCK2_9BACT|nr:hypothetical protein MFFC18_21420 [Mariniblastus fucicola]